MIKKTENCLYCGEKMESVTAKKRFCSDLHRVYWNREQKAMKLLGDSFENNKTEFTDGNIKRVDPLSNEGEIIQRIAKIEELLLAPPKYLPSHKRTLLENELSGLKYQLQSK